MQRSSWTRNRRNGGVLATQARTATRVRRALDIVARLQGMEDLTIDDIALDETQARVTIDGVPDQPGIAAGVFEAVADGGHLCRHDRAKLRPRRQGEPELHRAARPICSAALAIAEKVADAIRLRRRHQLAEGGQTLGPGHRHAQPFRRGASALFRSLAEAGINVEMISTSEVRVNVRGRRRRRPEGAGVPAEDVCRCEVQ